jgi:hypothetical protein
MFFYQNNNKNWVYYDWPKPRLAEDQLAENLNWPTSRLAEATIGRKLKLAENEQVDLHSRALATVHLLIFGQFQVFLLVLLFYFLWLSMPLKFYPPQNSRKRNKHFGLPLDVK